MKYNFDEIIERKNNKYSFSVKWQSPDYILNQLGVKCERDDMICLETADMDYKVAPCIINDLMEVTKHGIYGYSHITKEYKEAVCNWYLKHQNWEFNEDDIFYFPGTHEAIAQCVKHYTKENDGVIVLTPCYGYHSDVDANNRRYVCVDLINNNGYFTIDYEALEKACKDSNNTMLIMCHPHNPTGRVFTKEELVKVYNICLANNVLIVSDEVHSDIIRKGIEFIPMMKACGSTNLISCTAVNKTFNLAGLAMTNVIIRDEKLKKIMSDYFILPSPFGIQAVISAYTKGEDWVKQLNQYTDLNLKECIDFIKTNLPKVKVSMPEGGYSFNMDFSAYGLSDEEVVNKIYVKAGVILNSGLFFDDKLGKQVHRACIASPKAICLEALKRIAKEFNN